MRVLSNESIVNWLHADTYIAKRLFQCEAMIDNNVIAEYRQ